MTDVQEAILAIKAAKSISASILVCASMTFDPTPKGFRTIMGTSIEHAVNLLAEAGADIIGSNCGNGIRDMGSIAEQFMKLSILPVIIQSNAGLPMVVGGNVIYPETPESMAEQILPLINCGVKIIGGCCGTTPAHTSALARIVRERNSRQ
jgi:5-methyltetrahydrofolate--homocysteine methyltransferase